MINAIIALNLFCSTEPQTTKQSCVREMRDCVFAYQYDLKHSKDWNELVAYNTCLVIYQAYRGDK